MSTLRVHAVRGRGRVRACAGPVRCGAARRSRQCACAASASRWSAPAAAGRNLGRRGLRGATSSPGRWPNRVRCGPRHPTTDFQVGPLGFGRCLEALGPPGGRVRPAAGRAGQRLWSASGGEEAQGLSERPSSGSGSIGHGNKGCASRGAGGRVPSHVA